MMPRQKDLGVAQAPPPPPLEPRIVPGLVLIPLEPRVLNHVIQAMGLHAMSFFPTTKASWVCTAGATTCLPLPMPDGYIAVCTDYILSSDFYDPNITVNVYVDDRLTTPFGIALTGLTAMEYAEYHVKYKDVLVEVINASAFDAQVSFQVFACFVQKSFYEEFYRPVINYIWKALEEVARG
ncbi:hypothetical protein ES703_19660 [subsurface metagenome]